MTIKIVGVALLYQKREKDHIVNTVRCYLDDFVEGEDEFFYKANAERSFNDDPTLVGSKIAAWQIVYGESDGLG